MLFQLVARPVVPAVAVAVAVIIDFGTCEFRKLTVRIVLFNMMDRMWIYIMPLHFAFWLLASSVCQVSLSCQCQYQIQSSKYSPAYWWFSSV